tara:strand:+ start:4444 stop:4680 length:237 start_codon:yes stop_codon:yes gene_type:complete
MNQELIDIIKSYMNETYPIKRTKEPKAKRFKRTLFIDDLTPIIIERGQKEKVKNLISNSLAKIFNVDDTALNSALKKN